MNKGAGLAVILAVVVAALRLSPGPTTPAPQPRPEAGSRLLSSKRHLPKPNATVTAGGCAAYSPAPAHNNTYPRQDDLGSAQAIIDKFFASDANLSAKSQSAAESGVRYAIALAPDPRHTNLSVMFDRQMVAIQEAAQDEGYTYNSSWLPWSLDSQSYPLLGDQQLDSDLADRREACPGILLFRKSAVESGAPASGDSYKNALVVLVVGEQPTGGVNQDQWDNAMQWLTAQPSPKTVLHILGPTFSGSLVSLDRNLQKAAPTFGSIQVLSGTVSSCSSILWFQSQKHASFGTFQETDELQIYRLLSYLNHHGSAPSDSAILSEDETAYGASATPSTDSNSPHSPQCHFNFSADRPIELAYPRDMSALRAEYQKESVFSSSASGHQPHAILQDGAEPNDDASQASDTIQTYSGHVTPLAQEAILYGIVSELRTHHTHYLLLRCTNPLDYIFLTRFFHRAYPEGRIVIVGQDLLFRREIDTTEFRGVLSLSNYPLLPRDEHWSRLDTQSGINSPHSHRVFESNLAEGTYLAARYTFDATDCPPSSTTPPTLYRMDGLPGYADPFWLDPKLPGSNPSDPPSYKSTHAPTWLTVVGRDGFWPVAVLNDATTPKDLPKDNAPPLLNPPPSSMVQLAPDPTMQPDDPRPPSLPLAWQVCAICALLLVLYQAYGIFPFKKIPSSGIFSVFRPGSAPSQHILLGISCVLAVVILLDTASVFIPLFGKDHFPSAGGGWQVGLDTISPWLAVVALFCFLLMRTVSVEFKNQVASLCIFMFLTLLLGFTKIVLQTVVSQNTAAGIPLFYRMAHITSGVSPLLPVIFLSIGFYLWIWQAMAGNLLLCDGRPFLPWLSGLPALTSWRKRLDDFWCRLLDLPFQAEPFSGTTLAPEHYRISHAIDKRITLMASPLSAPLAVLVPPFLIGLSALCLFGKNLPLLSLEGKTFTFTINIALLIGFLLTVAESNRLFWTWIELRRLLTALNRYRLRRTFARLRAVPSSSLWGMSGNVQRIQYSFFSQQRNAANRLSRLYKNTLFPPNLPALEKAVTLGKVFAENNAPELTAGPCWTQPVAVENGVNIYIREIFANAVAEVIQEILMPRWTMESTSLSLATSSAAVDERERNIFDMKLSDDSAVRMAEEFVCFHYIAFIQNILARMRSMVFSMVCLFVSVCFAISFYPFVPRTQVSLWMMLNLILITFTVIYVYAGMERDETLSYISNTKPGKLSPEFWLKTAGFLAGPVIGILTTQFPAIADSVLGWLQPGLDAFKP